MEEVVAATARGQREQHDGSAEKGKAEEAGRLGEGAELATDRCVPVFLSASRRAFLSYA